MVPPRLPSAAVTKAVRRRLISAVALILSDILGFAVAFILAGGLGLAFSELILGRPYAVIIDRGWSRSAEVALACGLAIAWFYLRGHYTRRIPMWGVIGHVVLACGLALLLDGFLRYAARDQFSRMWLVTTWVMAPVTVLMARRLCRRILDWAGLWTLRAVVVGDAKGIERGKFLLEEAGGLGYVVVAEEYPGLSDDEISWPDLMGKHDAHAIILCMTDSNLRHHAAEVRSLGLLNLPFILLRDMEGLPVSSLSASHFLGREAVYLVGDSGLGNSFGRLLKVAFDLLVALALLVLMSPFLLIIAAAVAVEGRPVLFFHQRVGRDGRRFRCIKFRTMVSDAEQRLQAVLDRDEEAMAEWRRYRKLRDDPRVTRLGAWLRRTSLDELPQLINVLKGDMSLVGPRPITKGEAGAYGKDFAFYAMCRPGITGLWQVSGRNEAEIARRVELDRWYAVNWSLWLDMVLLLKTIPVLFNRRGAY